MALKITKSEDPLSVENVCILIYGQPGIGKTSSAFTAADVLLLDFDGGAYRSQYRRDTVQVRSWSDVAGMTEEDLAAYQTVAVDTVGRLLDSLTAHLIGENPKLGQGSGALSLQGYGQLKAAYATWLRRLLTYRKDVVLIAHDREDKSGDDQIVRPDIQGASQGEVLKRADGAAYMHAVGKRRILDFTPTDRWIAKNPAGFEPIEVPHFSQEPAFLGGVLSRIKQALNALSEEQTAVMKAVDDWRAKVDEAEDAEAINALVAETAKLGAPVGPQAKRLVAKRAKSLGLEYDAKAKAYAAKAEATA